MTWIRSGTVTPSCLEQPFMNFFFVLEHSLHVPGISKFVMDYMPQGSGRRNSGARYVCPSLLTSNDVAWAATCEMDGLLMSSVQPSLFSRGFGALCRRALLREQEFFLVRMKFASKVLFLRLIDFFFPPKFSGP